MGRRLRCHKRRKGCTSGYAGMLTCKQSVGGFPNISPGADGTKSLRAPWSMWTSFTSGAGGISGGWHKKKKVFFFFIQSWSAAMLSLWVSSPIFPRYLLLPSIPGKPAHSTRLHPANICSPILHWLTITNICFSVPLGEGTVGVTSHKDILASQADHLPSFPRLLPSSKQSTV